MPLFAFACARCHHEEEMLVRASDRPACPQCGAADMVKQLSHFAAVSGGRAEAAPAMGCGKPSCCQMQGGCGLN